MPKFEVVVRTQVDCYYLVDAKDEAEARIVWARGTENGEFINEETVYEVIPYDNRFDEDDADAA